MQCGCLKDMYKGGNEESVPVNVVIVAKSHGFFFSCSKEVRERSLWSVALVAKSHGNFLEKCVP